MIVCVNRQCTHHSLNCVRNCKIFSSEMEIKECGFKKGLWEDREVKACGITEKQYFSDGEESLVDIQRELLYLEQQLKEAKNIIWQLTDGSESSDENNLHECHYCKATSWCDIEHKPHCIVKKAEEFYCKETK